MAPRKKPGPKPGSKRQPGSGRKKGTLNKVSAAVKDGIQAALDDERGGSGLEFWVSLKQTYPQAFAAVCAKFIPVESRVDLSDRTVLVLRNYTGIEWEHRAKAAVEAAEVVH